MQLYAITDRRSLGESERVCDDRLLTLCVEWARGGVQTVQIREKDLDPRSLLALAQKIVRVVRAESAGTRVLLNGDSALALASEADGVHLPGDWSAGQIEGIRRTWLAARKPSPTVSVACHSLADVERAKAGRADVALLAPIFGKQLPSGATVPALGVSALARACRAAGELPVIALGGVTVKNAHLCTEAGCAGVAGIRLFSGEGWRSLRR